MSFLPHRRERVLVIGCGALGATLAAKLSLAGRDVCVVDTSARALKKLSSTYAGFTECGDGSAADMLEHCGIEDAEMVLALTTRDNTNIAIGLLASEIYEVPQVFVHLYDKRKAELLDGTICEVLCPTSLCEQAFAEASGIDLPGDEEL